MADIMTDEVAWRGRARAAQRDIERYHRVSRLLGAAMGIIGVVIDSNDTPPEVRPDLYPLHKEIADANRSVHECWKSAVAEREHAEAHLPQQLHAGPARGGEETSDE